MATAGFKRHFAPTHDAQILILKCAQFASMFSTISGKAFTSLGYPVVKNGAVLLISIFLNQITAPF